VLGADYAGVDLLGDEVIEVNGIPGWSGVERACGVDVALELVVHVERLVGA
jgi:glutathione synthase/RimK-type ligase-like ATP-grasp enzyme